MTKNQLAFILKYSSPNEIYVITQNNELVLLKCPFKVEVVKDVGHLLKEQIVEVDEVKVTSEVKTVYVINGNPYYYFHFTIRI